MRGPMENSLTNDPPPHFYMDIIQSIITGISLSHLIPSVTYSFLPLLQRDVKISHHHLTRFPEYYKKSPQSIAPQGKGKPQLYSIRLVIVTCNVVPMQSWALQYFYMLNFSPFR